MNGEIELLKIIVELLNTIKVLREKIQDLELKNANLRSELIVEQNKNLS
jgi:hypothetical protein